VEIRGEHAGSADDAVLALARRSGRVLLTRDKDFGELVVRHGQRSGGVALVRYRHGDPQATAEAILPVIGVEGEALKGSFVVIDHDRTRILPLPG
jgi:predicted nuclease of predicted toxin-antitoxin system